MMVVKSINLVMFNGYNLLQIQVYGKFHEHIDHQR